MSQTPAVEKSNGGKKDGKQLRNLSDHQPSLFISQWRLRAFRAGSRKEDIGEVRERSKRERKNEWDGHLLT